MILDTPPAFSLLSMVASSPPPSSLITYCTVAVAAAGSCYLLVRLQNRPTRASSSPDSSHHLDDDDDIVSSLLFKTSSAKKDASSRGCIYLDYNATTPVHPLVLVAMLPFLTQHFGNPSSSHWFGSAPHLAVQRARQSVLDLLGAEKDEPPSSIWFTGCGTEADNLAIQLALQSTSTSHMQQGTKKHIVTSNVEHPAIDVCLRALMQKGGLDATFVPVQQDGRVMADDVIRAIRSNTVLVTLMAANNESGALQPVREVSLECRKRGILCHTDAAQAAGKVDVSLEALGHPDMVTLVGHKIGAPKGIAALYVRDDCCNERGRSLPPGGIMLLGGGQEGGRRGGTENVPYIVGMGKAAELVRDEWKKNAKHMEAMRQRLLDKLTQMMGKDDAVRPNGPLDPSLRLPNTLSVGLCHVHSGELLSSIQDQVAASAGAACHSQGSSVSAILQAMQVPMEYAAGTLRLSVGPSTTAADVDRAALIISDEAKRQLESSVKR